MEKKFTRRETLPLIPALFYSMYEGVNQQEPPFEKVLEEQIRLLKIELNNTGTYDDALRLSVGVLAHQELFEWFVINNPEVVNQLYSQSSQLYEPFHPSGLTSHIPEVWIKIKNMGLNLLKSEQAKEQFNSGFNRFASSIEGLLIMPEIVSVFIKNNRDKFSRSDIQEICEEYATLQIQSDLITGVLSIQKALMGDLPDHPTDLTFNLFTSSSQNQASLQEFDINARDIAINWLMRASSKITGQFPFELNETLVDTEVFIPLTLDSGQLVA